MYGSTAAAVRKNKEAHPEKYCAVKHCLWALRSGPCPKHCNMCGATVYKDGLCRRCYDGRTAAILQWAAAPLSTDDIGEGCDI